MSKAVIFPGTETTVLSVRVSVASAELPITNPADARVPAINAAILAGRRIPPAPTLMVVSSIAVTFISLRVGQFSDNLSTTSDCVVSPSHGGGMLTQLLIS